VLKEKKVADEYLNYVRFTHTHNRTKSKIYNYKACRYKTAFQTILSDNKLFNSNHSEN